MFSGFTAGLNFIYSPEDGNGGRILRSFQSFLNIWSYSGDFHTRVVVMVRSVFWSLFPKRRNAHESSSNEAPVTIAEAAGDGEGSPFFDAVTWLWSLMDDDDAENVQGSESETLRESLFVPLPPFQTTNCLVIHAAAPTQANTDITEDLTNPSQIFCKICLEERETSQMFTNTTCSHSFCYECTTKHIVSKIQDDINMVTCPEINCKAMLDSNSFRSIIPKDFVIRWDESLCKSLFKESHKLYCPFRDCSAMLVNDSVKFISQTKCPECKRLFCAQCIVPWHSEFTCKEFLKLNGGKRERGVDHLLTEKLAKKKKWRKCPGCKMYVEKNEGCLHITCRCKYQFCYKCGSKWGPQHHRCSNKL